MVRDDRTAEEIQRDIERERADLSDTLSSINESLSFAGLGATLSDQVQNVGSDLMDDLGGTLIERAREKPIAAGLVLAGLAWMAFGASDRRDAPVFQRTHSARDPSSANAAQDDLAARGQTVHGNRDCGRDDDDNRIERLAREAQKLRSCVNEGTETLTAEARARVVQAREAAAEATEQAIDGLKSGAGKTKDKMQDNPLALGGLALAIGAAIGGALMFRQNEDDARKSRDALYREADRILEEELQRSASPTSRANRG
jgi:F0F1-type ATP synthase membrane subunit b/b'